MSAKRRVVRIEVDEVRQLLLRVQPMLAKDDYDKLANLMETLIEVTRLLHQEGATLKRLRRMLGQASSEKTADVFGGDAHPTPEGAAPAQRDKEQDGSVDPAAQSEDVEETNAKNHGRIPAAAYLAAAHIVVQHPHLHVGDECPGCARGKLFDLKESAQTSRIFGQAPLVAICWDCERLRCSACGAVYTAKLPENAQGPKYSETAASMMALLRYGTGVPLNRLERLQRNLQTPVPASTQWDVVRDRALVFLPVYTELVRLAASGNVLHNDDTYVRILEFMGKRRAKLLAKGELPDPERTGLFTTGVVSDTAAGPIALFFTGRKHAGENLTKLLDERAPGLPPPIQMCDGLDRNLPKGHVVVEANCLSHGRRHVVDEADNFPEECRHVLELLAKVFANEKICRKHKLSPEDRLRLHQERSAPVMAELHEWIKAQLDGKCVEPNSGLGEAFNYMLKRWNKITLFLRMPAAPLENNRCERALKKAIQHRNASLFYRTLRGAHVGDMHMALIYTAELHRENPFDYLTALQLNEADVAVHPEDWLPWNYRATIARLEEQRSEAA